MGIIIMGYTSLWMAQNYGCCLCCRPPSCLQRVVNVAFKLSVTARGPSCKCLLVGLINNRTRPAKQVWADSLSCNSAVNHPVQFYIRQSNASNVRRWWEWFCKSAQNRTLKEQKWILLLNISRVLILLFYFYIIITHTGST